MISYLDFINFTLFVILVLSVQTYLFFYLRNKNIFLDDDFNKPQSVHEKKIPRIGGILVVVVLILLVSKDLISLEQKTIQLFFIILTSFFLGFLDDSKIITEPLTRFIFSIILFLLCITLLDIKITSFGDEMINKLNNIYFFQILLCVSCFFAVCNGANLIDGFNGLLLTHTIACSILFLIVSFYENNLFLIEYLIFFLSFLIIPSLLNFPRAKIFMGDSGAYICGAFLGFVGIELNKNLDISPFFITLALIYFVFELLYSIVRKLYQNKNPFKPDDLHLHLVLYKYLKKKNPSINCNFLTTLTILCFNLPFFIIGLIYYDNILITKVVCFVYILCYLFFYKKVKNLAFNLN